jgi:hypothetical protein
MKSFNVVYIFEYIAITFMWNVVMFIACLFCSSYFDSIDICKVRPGWQEVRLESTFPTNAQGPVRAAALTIFENTQVDFSLYQSGDR